MISSEVSSSPDKSHTIFCTRVEIPSASAKESSNLCATLQVLFMSHHVMLNLSEISPKASFFALLPSEPCAYVTTWCVKAAKNNTTV